MENQLPEQATPRDEERKVARRDILTGLGAALAGVSGVATASPAQANAGAIRALIGSAQAQGSPQAVTDPWWPSRWGPEDQAGASNWITPEKILEALALVKQGKTYEIGRIYDSAMPAFGERKFNLRIPGAPTGGPLGTNGVFWMDEFLATEIGQVGTQFDGLGHIGIAVKTTDKAQMRFYNGLTVNDIVSAYGLKKLGVENVRPLITRGLLIDVRGLKGRDLNLGEEVTMADVTAALQRQNVSPDWLKPGDMVGFYTGWSALWGKDNAQFMKGEPGPGMDVAKWLSSKQVSVVGADTWGVEVVPNPNGDLAFPAHQEWITRNGIYIHENLDLAQLAADKVYQFCYIMTPIRIRGGTGSPGRPLALI